MISKKTKFLNFIKKNCFSCFILPLTFIAYFQTLFFEFVWDDNVYHLTSPLLNPIDLLGILFSPQFALYIPFPYLVWALLKVTSQIFTFLPLTFLCHFANLFFHCLILFQLYKFLLLIHTNKIASILLVALFTIHPIQSEVVAWVSELRSLMAVFFGLVSLNCYITHSIAFSYSTGKISNFWKEKNFKLSWLFFLLGILSKPTIIVLPLLFFILDFCYLNKFKNFYQCLCKFLFFAPIIIFNLILTKSLQTIATDILPLGERILIALDIYGFYIYHFLVPINLSPNYGRTPLIALESLKFAHITALVIFGLIFILYFYKKFPLALTALLFFFIALFPVVGIIPFNFQNISLGADRYFYLAFLAPILFITQWQKIFLKKYVICFSIAIIIILFSFTSLKQVPIWKNSGTLWTHSIELNPSDLYPYRNRANYYRRNNKNKEAIQDYQKVKLLYPNDAFLYYDIGSTYLSIQKYNHAIDAYQKGAELSPNMFWPKEQIISLYLQQLNNPQKALESINLALDQFPQESRLYNYQGVAHAQLNNYKSAIVSFSRAININPNYLGAYKNRSQAYEIIGDDNSAKKDVLYYQRLQKTLNLK